MSVPYTTQISYLVWQHYWTNTVGNKTKPLSFLNAQSIEELQILWPLRQKRKGGDEQHFQTLLRQADLVKEPGPGIAAHLRPQPFMHLWPLQYICIEG